MRNWDNDSQTGKENKGSQRWCWYWYTMKVQVRCTRAHSSKAVHSNSTAGGTITVGKPPLILMYVVISIKLWQATGRDEGQSTASNKRSILWSDKKKRKERGFSPSLMKRLSLSLFCPSVCASLSLSSVAVTSLAVTCQSGCRWRRFPQRLSATVHLAEGPLTTRLDSAPSQSLSPSLSLPEPGSASGAIINTVTTSSGTMTDNDLSNDSVALTIVDSVADSSSSSVATVGNTWTCAVQLLPLVIVVLSILQTQLLLPGL